MNYWLILESVVVFIFLLLFIHNLLSVPSKVDYGPVFLEDVYASLIALDKANLINNSTLLCSVVREIVPKNYNISIEYNDQTVCAGSGTEVYKVTYLYLNNTSVEYINVSILQ